MQDVSGLCVINVAATWQKAKNIRAWGTQTASLDTIETGAQAAGGPDGSKSDDLKRFSSATAAAASTADSGAANSSNNNSIAVGTDDRIGGDAGYISARPDGSQFVYQIKGFSGGHFDEVDLAKFLSGAYPDIVDELKGIAKSSAFDGYEPGWKDKTSVGARLLSTFPSVVYLQSNAAAAAAQQAFLSSASAAKAQQSSPVQQLQVTGVSWNAAGALVAASYGRVDSFTWSTSNGFIAVWAAAGQQQRLQQKQQQQQQQKDDAAAGGSSSAASSGSKAGAAGAQAGSKNAAAGAAGATGTGGGGALDEKPIVLVETDAFATCVAFHPSVSTLVAAGTFSGEVLLYDTSATAADESSGASAKLLFSNFGSAAGGGAASDRAHTHAAASKDTAGSVTTKDPINKLVWIEDSSRVELRESHRYLLCAASSDGSVAFWSVHNRFQEPVALGVLQNRQRGPLGVLGVSFACAGGQRRVSKSAAAMVMATDSGDVVRGKVPPFVPAAMAAKTAAAAGPAAAAAGGAAAAANRVPGMNDTDFAGEAHRHSGPVNAVDASPFFRNVFLTCSSDGAVRLFSMLDMQHKLALVPSPDTKHFLYGAAFSPVRPSVIAACSRNSQVHLYDLAASRVKPAFTCDKAGTEDSAVLCLGWNAQGNYFATGDAKGCVRVWSVAAVLCETTELERLAIRQAAAGGGAGAGGPDSPVKAAAAAAKADPLSQSALDAGRFADVNAGPTQDPLMLLYGFSV